MLSPESASLCKTAVQRPCHGVAVAWYKDNPADLINVALEELVRGRYELPGHTTLDELTARVRAEVNTELFATIGARLTTADRDGLERLLEVDPVTKRSAYDRLKQPAKAATLTKFKQHLAYLGPARAWLAGIPPSKVAHFAGEAHVTDVADLAKMGAARRLALVVCRLHQTQVRARDEVATMFCKRMAAITKKAKEYLVLLREQHRADTERLLGVFGDVLGAVREGLGPGADEGTAEGADGAAGQGNVLAAPIPAVCERTGRLVLATLHDAGGIRRLAADHETVSAHHGNNHAPLLERFYRSHRPVLFALLDVLELQATSTDRMVLDAVAFLKANRHRIGELVRDHQADGTPLDLSFASEQWQQVLRSRRKPGRLHRRHLEVCVFSALAAELRSGDVAVVGSDAYANLYDQLLSWRECEPLVADYCAEAGIPTDAAAFAEQLRGELAAVADRVDAGYPDNADLVIDEGGHPVLKRRQGKDRRSSALALEAAITERIPERGLLDVLARTAYWLGWHRHFGPASGSDPKLRDALGRYVLLVFCYGANLGPTQLARHMRGHVSPHELSLANKHASAAKLQAASTDVINAFAQLDLPRVWGDGSRVAVDGSQIDTWADNLLAETSIRYGGTAGSRSATSRIRTSHCSVDLFRVGCGRPSTSSAGCYKTPATSNPTRSMRICASARGVRVLAGRGCACRQWCSSAMVWRVVHRQPLGVAGKSDSSTRSWSRWWAPTNWQAHRSTPATVSPATSARRTDTTRGLLPRGPPRSSTRPLRTSTGPSRRARWKVAPSNQASPWTVALTNLPSLRIVWPWSSCGAAKAGGRAAPA